ncbi:MAG: hypothetical protein J7K88_05855, partial [Candidatus Fermentibacteraceae bacterium]|nr:hypothetical protein [Candidatus Fermentibacteraceae bacterium]
LNSDNQQAYESIMYAYENMTDQISSEDCANIELNISGIAGDAGKLDESIEHAKLAYTHYKANCDFCGMVATLVNISTIERLNGNRQTANDVIKEALKDVNRCKVASLRLIMRTIYGKVLSETSCWEEALKYHLSLLEEFDFRDVGEKEQGVLHTEIGHDYSSLNSLEKAINHYSKARRHFEESDSKIELGLIYATLADTLRETGEMETACEYLELAFPLVQKYGSEIQRLSMLITYSEVNLVAKRIQTRILLEKAIDDFSDARNRIMYGYLHGLLGVLNLLEKKFDQAIIQFAAEKSEYDGLKYIVGCLVASANLVIAECLESGKLHLMSRLLVLSKQLSEMGYFSHANEIDVAYLSLASCSSELETGKHDILSFLDHKLDTIGSESDDPLYQRLSGDFNIRLREIRMRITSGEIRMECPVIAFSRLGEFELRRRM